MTDLTEQFNHGLLPDDRLYYYRFKGEPDVKITTQYGLYCEEADNKKEIEVIDFVPSYSEYLALQSDQLAKNEGVEINAELENSIKDLKHRNENLRLALKTYELPEIQKILTDWRTGELDKKFNKFEKENSQLKSKYEKECHRADELEDSYWKEVEKNKKLKELLKECKDTMNKAGYLFAKIDDVKKAKRLLKQIEEVIK